VHHKVGTTTFVTTDDETNDDNILEVQFWRTEIQKKRTLSSQNINLLKHRE